MAEVVSLNTVVSTIVVLRTLIVVWGLFPVVMVATPSLFGLILFALDTFTIRYGFVSMAGTIGITFAGRAVIAAYAPSQKHKEDAFRKSAMVLPMLSFWGFQAILHLAMVPLGSALGISYLLRISPSIPYVEAIRIAASMLLLGLTVVIRYIGPVSVMRCSAFPVVASPLISAMRSFWTKCSSFDAFITMIAAPSDTPGVLMQSPFIPNSSTGRRFQTPAITTTSLLLAFSLLLAWIAAKVLGYRSNNSFQNEVYVNSSLLTVFSHLFMTCLDGKSHELSPLRYHRTRLRSLASRSNIGVYLHSTILSALLAPLSLHVVTTSGEIDIRWNLILYSTLVAILISIYLSVLDLMARNFLCTSGFNLHKLITQVAPDVNPSHETDVIVKCLLFEDSVTVHSVMLPTPGLGTNPPDEEEIYRNKGDSAKMAVVMTNPAPDSGLEDDLLRLLILESFGGKDPDSTVHLGASMAHQRVVKIIVTERASGLVAPIVRALCAYVAGLGIALKDSGNANKSAKARTGIIDTWVLPPGTLACSERALVGATRCVVHSISSFGPAAMDWRGTELSVFVPVVFISAFQLRSGIQVYGKTLLAKGSECKVASCLSRLEQVCDACALYLMTALQSMEARTLRLTIPIKDCHLWLESLAEQGDTRGTNAPVLIRENDKPIAIDNRRAFDLLYY